VSSLEAVTALVPFLRARHGPAVPGDLLAADLIADPDRLAAEIAATAGGRQSDDPQVLASLWWQAYSYRIAGTTLAAWVVAGSAPDPAAAAGGGVGVSRARPSSLVVGPDAADLADLDTLAGRLFGGHLDPLAESLRARHPIGRRLVWGNAAASIASCLGAVACADGAAPNLGEHIDAATATLPHGMAGLGTWVEPHRRYRRTTCCLWWKTAAANGALCEDCPLRGERSDRAARASDRRNWSTLASSLRDGRVVGSTSQLAARRWGLGAQPPAEGQR
jgi:ferric iron reductase protein FhuF